MSEQEKMDKHSETIAVGVKDNKYLPRRGENE